MGLVSLPASPGQALRDREEARHPPHTHTPPAHVGSSPGTPKPGSRPGGVGCGVGHGCGMLRDVGCSGVWDAVGCCGMRDAADCGLLWAVGCPGLWGARQSSERRGRRPDAMQGWPQPWLRARPKEQTRL